MISGSGSSRVALRSDSISPTNAETLPPARAAASHSVVFCMLCRFLQLLDAARADAARGKVDDAQQRVVVVGVFHQAQIGQRVLDLLPLEEAQPAIHAVRQSGRHQRMFQHARLRIGAVQQRDLREIDALAIAAAGSRRR